MAVPKYFEFFPTVLKCVLPGHVVSSGDLRDYVVHEMNLTEDDLSEYLPSGKQLLFVNRIHWAVTYLKKGGLIDSPSRAQYQITEQGKTAYQQTDGQITLQYLKSIPAFEDFVGAKKGDEEAEENQSVQESSTPEESIGATVERIHKSLREDILTEIIRKSSPVFFEHLVVKLMGLMGYGEGKVTKGSGDGGIDGIIDRDKLGLDTVCLQAKCWALDATVGRPEIQKFYGALAGDKMKKGVFITTAKFSKEAWEYARQNGIVLVDGDKLARLMVDHNLGVSVKSTYEIKEIDTDFFIEAL